MIKLLNLLYAGPDAPITQRFANKLVINGVDVYGKYNLKAHNGVDFAIKNGTKLYSCIEGQVIEAQADPTGYGNYVKIENNFCGVIYGHLKSFAVKEGDSVHAGQLIGLSDNTGNSTGPHLHFGVFPKPRDRANGYNGYIDPLDPKLVCWVEDLDEPCSEEELETIKSELANTKILLDQYKKENADLLKKDLLEKQQLREIDKNLDKVISS